MKVVLADLGHNQLTYSSDVYPLGIATLITYAQAYLDTTQKIDFHMVREPEDLEKLLNDGDVDILGLSSYAWNHELSRTAARYAKAKNPNTVNILGGPHFPLDDNVITDFTRRLSEIDVHVRGPTYESERAFLNFMQRYIEVGGALAGIYESPIPGNMWWDRKEEKLVKGDEIPRIADLDEIPSSYTSGLMDPFFETGYFPMMQIARGCPFTCTFCNSAVKENSRIYAHSVENVKADLTYISERVRPEINLCFADDNFGMYDRDLEIADFIGHLQKTKGWPKYIRTTTGKNRPDRIIQVMRKANGALPMTSAVQSLNPVVLKNIKRSNIKLETYTKVQDELKRQGMQSYGELILAMPGETKESFMDSIDQLLESGVKRVSAHQLMLLYGAPMATPDSRDQFGFITKHRVVARNIGRYFGNQPVVEVEEMVIGHSQMTPEDYLDIRVFHLLLTTFFYEGNMDEAFQFAKQEGIRGFDLVKALQIRLEEAPASFKKIIDDFIEESKAELHDDPESCIAWSHENLEGLLDGTIGGNLLSKYSMLLRFYVKKEGIEFLREVVRGMLPADTSAAKLAELEAVTSYLDTVMLSAPFAEALSDRTRWQSEFNVEEWVKDGYKRPLSDYTFDAQKVFDAAVPEERAKLIQTKLQTFGEHPAGLGKITRTMFARDMRRELL